VLLLGELRVEAHARCANSETRPSICGSGQGEDHYSKHDQSDPGGSAQCQSDRVAFFALLGAIFAMTQYLQFAHGYSAIEAGALMSPIALGLMMGAGSSSKAVRRLGISRVVAAGLSVLAILLALTMLFEPDTGGLVLAAWVFGLALAMGWVMAPATDAVVGAVPRAKTGIASATPWPAWSRVRSASLLSARRQLALGRG
jgi:hypothetical protein